MNKARLEIIFFSPTHIHNYEENTTLCRVGKGHVARASQQKWKPFLRVEMCKPRKSSKDVRLRNSIGQQWREANFLVGNSQINSNTYGEENGAPERIRTSDPQIRSLVLYPAELRVLALAPLAAAMGG